MCSNISSMKFWSVGFLLVAILLNTLLPDLAHAKPNTWVSDSGISSAWPVASYCPKRDGLKCSVADGHLYQCTVQRSHIETNICMHSSRLPLIAYELIPPNTRIHTNILWDWNLNKVWGCTITCRASSKFCSTGSPVTTGVIWKE
jgi:hypothetical protein